MRSPPGREYRVGRWARAERAVLVEHDVRALKAGLELVRQPPFDAPDVVVVKNLRARRMMSPG